MLSNPKEKPEDQPTEAALEKKTSESKPNVFMAKGDDKNSEAIINQTVSNFFSATIQDNDSDEADFNINAAAAEANSKSATDNGAANGDLEDMEETSLITDAEASSVTLRDEDLSLMSQRTMIGKYKPFF